MLPFTVYVCTYALACGSAASGVKFFCASVPRKQLSAERLFALYVKPITYTNYKSTDIIILIGKPLKSNM